MARKKNVSTHARLSKPADSRHIIRQIRRINRAFNVLALSRREGVPRAALLKLTTRYRGHVPAIDVLTVVVSAVVHGVAL